MTLARDEATFREGTKPALRFQLYLKDKYGKSRKLLLGELNTITLTYQNHSDSAVINTRNAQDVKNTNNVTISQTGEVCWELQVADTTVQSATLTTGELERHEAIFEWATVASIGRDGSARISIYIETDTVV